MRTPVWTCEHLALDGCVVVDLLRIPFVVPVVIRALHSVGAWEVDIPLT